MIMSKLKFGWNIKQNKSVLCSVQISNIPKSDAVEIQDSQICNLWHTGTHIFCAEYCSVSFEEVNLKFHVFKKCL